MATNLSCNYLGYTYFNDHVYNVSLLLVAVLASLLTLPAFVMNLAIIIAVTKKRIFHTPSFFIIANMAISDILSSCTAIPCLATKCVYLLLKYDPCSIAMVSTPLGYIFGITSFVSIVLQSGERFLAIFYPFWYREKLTNTAILIAIACTWVMPSILVVILMTTKDNQLFSGILGTSMLIFFIGTILLYVFIFKEVKRLEKQSEMQNVVSSSDTRKFKVESKVTTATAIILFTFGTCFAPVTLLTFFNSIFGEATYFTGVILYWCWFFGLLNSLLNPLVVCRQLTVLRRSVSAILCFWKYASQISPQRISNFQNLDFTRSRVSRVTVPPKGHELIHQ